MKTSNKHARVAFDFRGMSVDHLATAGDGVVQGLTNNSSFPSPPVALATLTSQAAALRATLARKDSGDRSASLTRQEAEQADALMASLAADGHYVHDTANQIAAGNATRAEELILSTGYKLAKKAVPHPRTFSGEGDGQNRVRFRVPKAGAKGAEAHLWKYGITTAKGKPPDTLIVCVTLEADIVISDVPSGAVVAMQHASVLPATHGRGKKAAATAGAAKSTPVDVSKERHPVYSYASPNPYQWSDFVYVVVP